MEKKKALEDALVGCVPVPLTASGFPGVLAYCCFGKY